MLSLFTPCFQPHKGYKIHEKIGNGSYGEVWKISKGSKLYALKRIVMMSDYDDILRILREVRVLKFLMSCPQSVMLVDGWIDQDGTRTNLVLEYFDYDLKQIVRNGFYFTEQHVRYIARQIFVGLAHLHASGIVHRDIKTANILINSKDCRTVICDYNLATCLDSEVKSPRTQNVVSRWYRAPEILQRCPYSEKVDIWAAGCVLCELASLRVLWSGYSDQDQLRKICATIKPSQKEQEELRMQFEWNIGEPNLHFDNFSREFNDFIKGILAFSPASRFSALRALQHPWLSSLSEPKLVLPTKKIKLGTTSEKTVKNFLASEVISIKKGIAWK